MKIVVTATAGGLDAQVDPRFGRSRYFVLVDADTMAFETILNEAFTAPGGAGSQAAQAMINKGVDVVISGNIGPNAFQVLAAAGVRIATGASGTVKDAVEQYKSGKLAAVGGSTVAAHAGMGPGMQPPRAAGTTQRREGELEQLSELVATLEQKLQEVKKRLEELKKG
jgi:predicted Fe-Mo cluster-binding NifX family protein